MPLGLGIFPLQGLLAAQAPHGLDRDDDIDLLNRQQRPHLPLMTGLPARSTPTGQPSSNILYASAELSWLA